MVAIAEKIFSLPEDLLDFLSIAVAIQFISVIEIPVRIHIFAMKAFHRECFNVGQLLLL